jgi:hypothetical protein
LQPDLPPDISVQVTRQQASERRQVSVPTVAWRNVGEAQQVLVAVPPQATSATPAHCCMVKWNTVDCCLVEVGRHATKARDHLPYLNNFFYRCVILWKWRRTKTQ